MIRKNLLEIRELINQIESIERVIDRLTDSPPNTVFSFIGEHGAMGPKSRKILIDLSKENRQVAENKLNKLLNVEIKAKGKTRTS